MDDTPSGQPDSLFPEPPRTPCEPAPAAGVAVSPRRASGKKQERFPEALTFLEELFVEEMVFGQGCGRPSVSYVLAGFKGSRRSINANAARLARKPRIVAAIAAAQERKLTRVHRAGDEEIARVGDVARFTVADLYDGNGKLIPLHELPPHVAIAIKAVRPGKFEVPVEFRDCLRANELLLRCFGRLKDATVNVEGPSLELILATSRGDPETGVAFDAETRPGLAAPQDVTGQKDE